MTIRGIMVRMAVAALAFALARYSTHPAAFQVMFAAHWIAIELLMLCGHYYEMERA